MFNHAPEGYICLFCNFFAGKAEKYNIPEDIIYRRNGVVVFIAPKWWVNNPGSVLVVSEQHYENIYEIPDEVIAEIYKVVKHTALAIRSTYDCEGVSTRQHNEPAGGQDVWHFHTHVFPRYKGDKLYRNDKQYSFVDAATRRPYAEKLRTYLDRF